MREMNFCGKRLDNKGGAKTKLLVGISQHLHEAYMLMKLYYDADATNSESLDCAIISIMLSEIDDKLNRRTRGNDDVD